MSLALHFSNDRIRSTSEFDTMRNLKRPLCAAALLLSLIWADNHAAAQGYSHGSIVGRWRSLETSKGGIGEVYEFRSDGTLDYSPGAVVEMPWRIENNQLVLPPETDNGAERKVNLKWSGENKVSLNSEAGVVIELSRVGNLADAKNPIIGEWIEHREMAGLKLEAHYLFYKRGKLLLVIPFVIQHGSYTISGSALNVKMQDRNVEVEFQLTDTMLTMSEPKGRHIYRYARY
jgi:hypothetical protein